MNETIVTPETSQAEPPASQKRLREILQVLGKHHITRGLTPAKLREILEDLGPTYVKLGQIMSMRSDMLPENYCRELTKLRTDCLLYTSPHFLAIVMNVPSSDISFSVF